MPLEINDVESARFRIVVARLTSQDEPLETVNAEAATAGVRLIIARVAAEAIDRVHDLEADGYRLMDTLVYYSRSLEDLPEEAPPPDGIRLQLATPKDAAAVATVARAAFQGYFGHYHADPRLDDAAADEAYVQWAETSTSGCGRERPVILAIHQEEIVGFATMRLNSDEEGEFVLSGIQPSAQRGGLYSCLLGRVLREGRLLAAQQLTVSTQITNHAVQRVWARQGLILNRGVYTFHKWFE